MKELEEWKFVNEYENIYEISSFGNIRRVGSNKQLKPKLPKMPRYYTVVLYKNGVGKSLRIHRMVAQAFIPNPENKPQVNHIDGNKLNNNVANLEWCDNKYNQNQARKLGLLEKRDKKLRKPVIQYDKTGKIIKKHISLIEAQKATGIKNGNISLVCNGKRKTAGGYIWKYEK